MRGAATPLLLVIVAIAGNLLTRSDAREQPLAPVVASESGDAAPDPTKAPSVAVGTVQRVVAPSPSGVDRSRELELPDGTFVPALNGAIDAAPLREYWGPFAWSAIVGVERSSAGIDWYRHADGSYSTTQMVWRSDLGREAAMTRVAHPGPNPAATGPAAAGPAAAGSGGGR